MLRSIREKIDDYILDSSWFSLLFVFGLSVFLMAIILLFSWMFSDKEDRGQCLQYHSETYMTYMMVNKVMIPMTQYRNVCDVWEFPETAGVEN